MTNTELTRSFALAMMKTQASFRQAIQRSLKKNQMDMTFEMLQIMVRLWKQEGVNQKELADKTFKDKVSLTYLINNLEKKGWVTRLEDADDRRNKLILLTAAGEHLRLQVMPLLEEIYAAAGQEINQEHLEVSIHYLEELSHVFKKI